MPVPDPSRHRDSAAKCRRYVAAQQQEVFGMSSIPPNTPPLKPPVDVDISTIDPSMVQEIKQQLDQYNTLGLCWTPSPAAQPGVPQ